MYTIHVYLTQAVLVHTAETVRFRYFVDLLMENRRPVMLVGNAGCGKTVLINDKLSSKLLGIGDVRREAETSLVCVRVMIVIRFINHHMLQL